MADKEETSIFDSLTEIFGFLQIAASPSIIGLILGYFIYRSHHDTFGFICAAIISALGLLVGIIWATKVSKKRGTVNFMSRVSATPELDKEQDQQKQD